VLRTLTAGFIGGHIAAHTITKHRGLTIPASLLALADEVIE
jgi:hypothetical protein